MANCQIYGCVKSVAQAYYKENKLEVSRNRRGIEILIHKKDVVVLSLIENVRNKIKVMRINCVKFTLTKLVCIILQH